MQSLNIFEAREGFLFEFASLSGVWKFGNLFYGLGPPVSGPRRFPTACSGDRVHALATDPVTER
jgi:hypothetical protein